jgi:hypothetical protein
VGDRVRELRFFHVADDALYIASSANGLVLRCDVGTGDIDVVVDFARPVTAEG